eukprot:12268953-Ditylum_brightwellii.AAC.1
MKKAARGTVHDLHETNKNLLSWNYAHVACNVLCQMMKSFFIPLVQVKTDPQPTDFYSLLGR